MKADTPSNTGAHVGSQWETMGRQWEIRGNKARQGETRLRKGGHRPTLVKTHVQTNFGRSDVVSRGRRKGLRTLSKVSKT